MGAIASLEADPGKAGLVLRKLFEGDTGGFAAWIAERTKSLVRAYDLEMRDADLETVTNFMRTTARRGASDKVAQASPPAGWPGVPPGEDAALPLVNGPGPVALGEDWKQA